MDLRVGVWRTEFRFNHKRGLPNLETDVEVPITLFSKNSHLNDILNVSTAL